MKTCRLGRPVGRPPVWPPTRGSSPGMHPGELTQPWETVGDFWEMISHREPRRTPIQPGPTQGQQCLIAGQPQVARGPAPAPPRIGRRGGSSDTAAPGPVPGRRLRHRGTGPLQVTGLLQEAAGTGRPVQGIRERVALGDFWEINFPAGGEAAPDGPAPTPAGPHRPRTEPAPTSTAGPRLSPAPWPE